MEQNAEGPRRIRKQVEGGSANCADFIDRRESQSGELHRQLSNFGVVSSSVDNDAAVGPEEGERDEVKSSRPGRMRAAKQEVPKVVDNREIVVVACKKGQKPAG